MYKRSLLVWSYWDNKSSQYQKIDLNYLRNVCACMNRYLQWSYSRAQKYIVLHSNTVFSLARLIIWLLKTSENTILLWRRIFFGEISVHTRANDSQASRFFYCLINLYVELLILYILHRKLFTPLCLGKPQKEVLF